MNPPNCLNCDKILPVDDRRPRKFCCRRCAGAASYKRQYPKNTPLVDTLGNRLSSVTVGTIGELKVILDLMNKGYHVYRNVCHSSFCDLAVVIGLKFLRIEVTTGNFSASGKLMYATHNPDRYDHLAVAMKSGEIFYFPDLPKLELSEL